MNGGDVMNRREFSKYTLMTLSGIALFDTLFRQKLIIAAAEPIANRWLWELHTMCSDLRTNSISQTQWQAKIDEFHSKLPLDDLMNVIDFDKSIRQFAYPDLGVVTTDPKLPKVDGISGEYSFIGRIFGMQKDRAIIPHGHQNMTSCHRVLKGEVLLRQYDRIKTEGEYILIRQTNEQQGAPGSFSSVSDHKNNVHWLIATTSTAYTFDVIVVGLNGKRTEIDNIDIDAGVRVEQQMLRVKKIRVNQALRKYGKTHH
ncbi:MAG: hypothetical protein C5B55_06000 [Blastocatellia bacterium]|nr:MAG: hypothetical protein C5B55_06000 [Blastocatellia bacterium]